MTTAATPLSIYQLRIVLRGISPLIWRRVLMHSPTTLAHLHATECDAHPSLFFSPPGHGFSTLDARWKLLT